MKDRKQRVARMTLAPEMFGILIPLPYDRVAFTTFTSEQLPYHAEKDLIADDRDPAGSCEQFCAC